MSRSAVFDAQLFDKIGPAVLFTHSQSGAYGWAIADARPALVKGIVAIEAGMWPFRDVVFAGSPDYFKDGPINKASATFRLPHVDPKHVAGLRLDGERVLGRERDR